MTKRRPKVIIVWVTDGMDGVTVVDNTIKARQKGYKAQLAGIEKTVTLKANLKVQTDRVYPKQPRPDADTLVINGNARNFAEITDKFWTKK